MTTDPSTVEKKTLEEAEREGLEYHHNGQDQKDNESSKPPPEEEIRVPAIWAIEAYPPTFIENLWSGLDRLGVLKTKRSDGVCNFLENIRTKALGGGSVNLDPIVRGKKYLFHGVSGPLPDGVAEIRLSIYQLIPSTTILICQFYLQGDPVSSVEAALKADYSTYSIKTGSSVSFIDVNRQKEEAVAVAREQNYEICQNWVKEHLPGYFSSDKSSFSIPTCDLITFKQYDPFAPEKQKKWGLYKSYIGILGLDSEYYLWGCDDLQGLCLQVDNPKDKFPNRITLTGKIDNILSNVDIKSYGQDLESQLMNWFRYLDHTLATWCIHVLAIDVEKQLLITRDLYGSVDISTPEKAIDSLFEIDHFYSFLQRNLVPFANDLKKYCNREHSFMHEIYEFKPIKDRKYNCELFENYRKILIMRAAELISIETHINLTASRLGQIISTISNDKLARSNLKLQKQVAIMSFTVLLLTIVQVCYLFKDNSAAIKIINKLLGN